MTEHKLKCRKCGDSHLTINCGKIKINTNTNNYNTNYNYNNNYNNNTNINNNNNNYYNKKYNQIKTYGVKILNFPIDITESELVLLTNDWGHINKIKVCNFEENTVVYLNFIYEEQADYFIKALDKTPFEYQILSITKV